MNFWIIPATNCDGPFWKSNILLLPITFLDLPLYPDKVVFFPVLPAPSLPQLRPDQFSCELKLVEKEQSKQQHHQEDSQYQHLVGQ